MKKAGGRIVFAAMSVAWLGWAGSLSATVFFDNTVNDLHTQFNPGTYEVGDEINLAGIGNLTYFSFEWWGTNTASPGNSSFAGAITATVQMYYNNGTLFNGYNAPGTNFFQETFSFASVGATPTARNTFTFLAGVDFPIGGLAITNTDITWSVKFTGLGATDSVGLDLYSPPVVGSEVGYGDYWQNAGVGWTLQTNSMALVDFGAYMATPEPSSMTLSLLGGVGMLTAMRWFRRKE